MSKPPSDDSPHVTSLVYDTAEAFLHDFQRGKIPAYAVNLEQWLVAHASIMVDSRPPLIRKKIMAHGNVYEFTMELTSIMYSVRGNTIVGEIH